MNRYERESKEFMEVAVLFNGETITEGVQFAVTTGRETRPAGEEFGIAEVVDGATGVMIEDYAPGVWTVWAKAESDPEIPVFVAAKFLVV